MIDNGTNGYFAWAVDSARADPYSRSARCSDRKNSDGSGNSTMLRRLLEYALRERSFRKRLPSEFGGTRLIVSPDSQLKYLKWSRSGFDNILLQIAKHFVVPNSVVWDIGANVGVFAFASASLARNGSVIAVEPDPFLVHLMTRALRIRQNRNLRIIILAAAVIDRIGIATIQIAARGRASNTLTEVEGGSQQGGVRYEIDVATITLDLLLERYGAPSFVKIDVEGAEALVLQGAARLLKDARPVFYIEVGDERCEAVTGIFKANDYVLFDGDSDISNKKTIEKCAFNTLAIPSERMQTILHRFDR